MDRRIVVSMVLAIGIATSGFATGQTEQADEAVTLEFSFWGSATEKAIVEGALASFTQHTGIEVVPLHFPREYHTKITTLLAANQPPNVGYSGAGFAQRAWEEGEVVNLLRFINDDPAVDVSSWVETNYFWYDPETILGVSGDLQAGMIAYNRDIFDAAGAQYPPSSNEEAWTWEEFLDVAKVLTIDENGNNANDAAFDPDSIVQYGAQIPLGSGMREYLLIRNDTAHVVGYGTEFGLSQPAGYQVLQALADAMNVHHVIPSVIAREAIPRNAVSLQTGRIAMAFTAAWETNAFAQTDGLNYDVGALPYFTTKDTVTGNAARVLFAKSDNHDESWDLIKFMASPEGGLELFKSGLWAPSKVEWYTDPEKAELWVGEDSSHPRSYVELFFPIFLNPDYQEGGMNVRNWGDIQNIITPALDAVWAGETTAREAMQEIEPEIRPLLEGSFGRYGKE